MLEQYQAFFGAGWYELVENSGARAEHLQHYLAAISHTDAVIGQLLNELASQPYEDETVVIGWQEWPDKATHEANIQAAMQDPRLTGMDMPFDGKRMIFAGFEVMLDL